MHIHLYGKISSEELGTMARLQCVRPGCSKEVDTPDTAQAIELLKIHDAKAHSIAIKPEKPRRPELATAGGAGLGDVLFSNGRAISSQTELDLLQNMKRNSSPRITSPSL